MRVAAAQAPPPSAPNASTSTPPATTHEPTSSASRSPPPRPGGVHRLTAAACLTTRKGPASVAASVHGRTAGSPGLSPEQDDFCRHVANDPEAALKLYGDGEFGETLTAGML